ncbi:MAG: urease accessory protein UreD [Burkholderiales bacterium]
MTASVALAASERVPEYHFDVSLVCDPAGRTYVGGQYVAYPYHLGRTLRNLGDPPGMPTLYVQSCSGGIFEGDDLRCRMMVGANARAHITTAASIIVHTMEEGSAAQHVEIDVAAGGYFEYFPDPIILFPDATLASTLSIRVAPGATVLAWDSFLAHDPKAQGKVFREFSSELSVTDEKGRLLARDRYRAEGAVFQRVTPGVMGAYRTQGSFILVCPGGPCAQWADKLREALAGHEGAYAGVSELPNGAGVWVRILAPDAAVLRNALAQAWSCAREMITGIVPAPRRK